MIGAFYTLIEEKVQLLVKIKQLEEDLVKSNHANLDLQYICDDQAKEIDRLQVIIEMAKSKEEIT